MDSTEQLTSLQQTFELLTKSKSILIALPAHPSTDAVAAGLALYALCEKLGKRIKIVASDFTLPPSHQFLPKSKEILTDITQLRKFVIILDIAKTPVEELSYDIEGDKLNIYITPKSGFFQDNDVKTSAGGYMYDAIVVLDAPNLPSLGEIFEQNADFFYSTPVINIDHHAANEQFGQVNVVDLVATSVSEIIFELIKAFGHKTLDEYIATNLLAGIIAKTRSFRSQSATPKSLAIASHLIAQGARRDEIVKNLYQTKSLHVIQLWGRALARLRTTANGLVVYSRLGINDFERSQTSYSDLPGILDEIMVNAEGAEIAFLCYERPDGVFEVLMVTGKSHNGLEILKPFKPVGNQNMTKATLAGSLAEAEAAVVARCEEYTRAVQ
jgi:phosphoesterase RecJ-like protein